MNPPLRPTSALTVSRPGLLHPPVRPIGRAVVLFYARPDVTPDILKRNVLKAYNTAQIVIRQALKLQEETGFLSYAPHFVCRTLLTAAVVTLSVLLSSHMKDVSLQSRQFAVHDAVSA